MRLPSEKITNVSTQIVIIKSVRVRMTRTSDVSEAAVYVEDRSHCSQFCLWTHLHGWRQLALTENKGK